MPKDSLKAMKWFRLAAVQGHAIAQANLGRQFYAGDGVPADYARAWAWFDRASAQGDRQSRRNRNIITEVMTSTQIAKAQELGRNLCEKIHNCTK